MKIIPIFTIIISVFLILSVLFQSRGSDLGMSFGGAGGTYRSKRGIEKVLFYATAVLAVLFATLAIVSIMLQ